MSDLDLEALEKDAYSSSFADGLIDLFVGLSLLWIGACWIWLPDLAGLAGVVPAVFVVPFIAVRRKVLGLRTGYVRWSAPRLNEETRNLGALIALGGAFFVLLVWLALTGSFSDILESAVPALPAVLLAVGAAVGGWMINARRMYLYALLLTVAGVVVVLAEGDPGWSLLGAGAVVVTTAVVLVARFFRSHPSVETS